MRKYMQYTQQVSWALVTMLCLSFFLSKLAVATTYKAAPGQFIEMGEVRTTHSGGSPILWDQRCWISYMSTSIPAHHAATSNSYPYPTTIDGYTGISIGGLLYVVYDGSFTTRPTQAITFTGGAVNYDHQGNATPSKSSVRNIKGTCWGTTDTTIGKPNSDFTVSVKKGIYVPKGHPSQLQHKLSNVYAGNANHTTSRVPVLIFSNQDSIDIGSGTVSCAVASPTTIEFGNINASNILASNVLLKSDSRGLDIICSSPTKTDATNVKISFVGGYSDDHWSHLNMVNKSNTPMAYIQGQYLNSANNLCQDHVVNEVGFDGTKHAKTLANVVAGITTHIPVTWGLCSNGSRLLGKGSAQATVNIDWD